MSLCQLKNYSVKKYSIVVKFLYAEADWDYSKSKKYKNYVTKTQIF